MAKVGDIIGERAEMTQGGRKYWYEVTEVGKDGEVEKMRVHTGKLLDKYEFNVKYMACLREELEKYKLIETGDHSKWEVKLEEGKVWITELENDGSVGANAKVRVYDEDTFLKLTKNKHFHIVTSGNRKPMSAGDLRALYEVDKFFN